MKNKSPASQLASLRWAKATPEQKKAHMEKMNTARMKKQAGDNSKDTPKKGSKYKGFSG